MKKFLASFMTMAMILSTMCMAKPAFAQESSNVFDVESTSESNVARNIDYWTFPDGSFVAGGKYVTVYPGAGENLKIHIYLTGGTLIVKVRPTGTNNWRSVATFKGVGHHYADLVSGTNGGGYDVGLYGTGGVATFSGGIYSE